jgi:heterodisulfide reductase subunit D
METKNQISTMAEMASRGEIPEYLFWVGCAGSFDDRAKRVSLSFSFLLNKAGISFAILGNEENCTGDPAKRAGNEFLFQMTAFQNIQVLNGYGVKKVVTACPHCFNTLKNEYPDLGGNYEVLHHSQLLQELLDSGKLSIEGGGFKGKKITYHDPCYLGRGNGIYEAPRAIISALDADLYEMKKSRAKGMCCGAGGAQMFKEAENGSKEVNIARTEQALETKPSIIAVGCPFCNTMMSDGVKQKESQVEVKDIAELLAENIRRNESSDFVI